MGNVRAALDLKGYGFSRAASLMLLGKGTASAVPQDWEGHGFSRAVKI